MYRPTAASALCNWMWAKQIFNNYRVYYWYFHGGWQCCWPHQTSPIPSCSPDLIYRVAEATSVEVRGKHNDFAKQGDYGYHTGITCLSPVVNIMRDPRWGRNQVSSRPVTLAAVSCNFDSCLLQLWQLSLAVWALSLAAMTADSVLSLATLAALSSNFGTVSCTYDSCLLQLSHCLLQLWHWPLSLATTTAIFCNFHTVSCNFGSSLFCNFGSRLSQLWQMSFANLAVALCNFGSCLLQLWQLSFATLTAVFCNIPSCLLKLWQLFFATLTAVFRNF